MLKERLKERWRKFVYPYGSKRMFSPRQWEWRDRILVVGELLAVLAAIAAIPVELSEWSHGPWLVIAATIIGTSALLWYAYDLISAGEVPLTPRSARRIQLVVMAMKMERQGAIFDWDNIDKDGRIPYDLSNWSGLNPELRAVMERHNVPLVVAAQILSQQGQASGEEDT